MKRFFSFIAIFFIIASCNSATEPQPEQVAQKFLTAFFNVDYDQILSMCLPGSQLKSDIERNAETIGGVSQAAQELYRSDLSSYHFTIDSVNLNSRKDSAVVFYTIIFPDIVTQKPGNLTMVKENQEWKIAKLL
ncbi:MAG: hypothetical protein LBC84_04605 [Prevotellaceae bacterium]|jgi:hypothetical protein|nr:hypothetical protein [Prevotellaceae bacterium]